MMLNIKDNLHANMLRTHLLMPMLATFHLLKMLRTRLLMPMQLLNITGPNAATQWMPLELYKLKQVEIWSIILVSIICVLQEFGF